MSDDVGTPESVAAAVKAAVDLCHEAVRAQDWETAHTHEDMALTLVARAAATGMDVCGPATLAVGLLDETWPRWCA